MIERKNIDPFNLLVDTFSPSSEENKSNTTPIHPNVIALARVYEAIDNGDLTVNGLRPDNDYPLGEYLVHGGRVRFDLSALNLEERQRFINYIFNQENEDKNNNAKINRRKFATHGRGEYDANGNIGERKTGILEAILDLLTPVRFSKHMGIDLPVGGMKKIDAKGTIEADGRWGHMYAFHDDDFLMIGVEGSAPGKTNLRTGESHSKFGGAGKFSAFMAYKINSKELHAEQQEAGKCPLSTKGKYNWACVKVTPQNLKQITSKIHTVENLEGFKNRLRLAPKKAEKVIDKDQRLAAMKKWQKASAVTNSVSRWAILGGIALAVIGVAIAFSPFPPGVAQAVGAYLTSLGISSAMGIGSTMAAIGGLFGVGVFGNFRLLQANKAVKSANKALAQIVKPVAQPQQKAEAPRFVSSTASTFSSTGRPAPASVPVPVVTSAAVSTSSNYTYDKLAEMKRGYTPDGNYKFYTGDFFDFTRKDYVAEVRVEDMLTPPEGNWKIHVSVDPTHVGKAWDLIFPILEKHKAAHFKISNLEALKNQNTPDAKRVTEGMQITIYVPYDQEAKYQKMLKEIENVLTQHAIAPGKISNTDKTMGTFSSIRYCGSEEYARSIGVTQYKPDDIADPFTPVAESVSQQQSLSIRI